MVGRANHNSTSVGTSLKVRWDCDHVQQGRLGSRFRFSRPFRPPGCGGLLTQGIGLRPQPWAVVSRPVGPDTRVNIPKSVNGTDTSVRVESRPTISPPAVSWNLEGEAGRSGRRLAAPGPGRFFDMLTLTRIRRNLDHVVADLRRRIHRLLGSEASRMLRRGNTLAQAAAEVNIDPS